MRPAQCQTPVQLSGQCPGLAFGNRRDEDGDDDEGTTPDTREDVFEQSAPPSRVVAWGGASLYPLL